MFKMKYKIYPYGYCKNRNHEVLHLLRNLVVEPTIIFVSIASVPYGVHFMENHDMTMKWMLEGRAYPSREYLVLVLNCQVLIVASWNNILSEMMLVDTVVVEQDLMLVCTVVSVILCYCWCCHLSLLVLSSGLYCVTVSALIMVVLCYC